ncbi:MAG: hypothetical protein JO136_21295, partial [Hyphomicrobiales bacterium]|nr:hypothetical protein [Hyphomicrobiales bacterium]
DIFERAAFGEMPILEHALVDLGRDRLSVQPGRREESPAAFAPRRQNQGSGAAP